MSGIILNADPVDKYTDGDFNLKKERINVNC